MNAEVDALVAQWRRTADGIRDDASYGYGGAESYAKADQLETCADELEALAARSAAPPVGVLMPEHEVYSHPLASPAPQPADELSASEALYAFGGWLTVRDEPMTVSARHNAAPMAERIAEFCKAYGFAAPRDGWDQRVRKMPGGFAPAAPAPVEPPPADDWDGPVHLPPATLGTYRTVRVTSFRCPKCGPDAAARSGICAKCGATVETVQHEPPPALYCTDCKQEIRHCVCVAAPASPRLRGGGIISHAEIEDARKAQE